MTIIAKNIISLRGIQILLCVGLFSFSGYSEDTSWWHNYTTVATDPEFKSFEEVKEINAECWRASGWFGGWYGYWFADMLKQTSDVPERWQKVIDAGSRPMMYYDAGEVGDFVTMIDEDAKSLLLHGWYWDKWDGQEGTPHWFGLEAFMNNPSWAPFPTADEYDLPAFTYPDGQPIPEGEIYGVMARRDLNNSWRFMNFTNPDISDELAERTGLAAFSEKQKRPPEVQQGSGWVIGRLISQEHANPQLLEFQCRELAWTIKSFKPWGVHIDNFAATDIWFLNSSFGLWSEYTFRDFLKQHFSVKELINLGVKNVETFSIREYLADIYGGEGITEQTRRADPRWYENVLFRAYQIHKTEKGIHYWTEIYNSGKQAMAEAGIDGPIYGNAMPLLPGGGFMNGICDIACFEWQSKGAYPGMPELGFPPEGRVAYVSRLGQKISNVSYCWPSVYVPIQYKGEDYENLHKVLAFDCLANRGILDFNHWYLDKYSPGSIKSARYMNDFIQSVADSLSGREYLADIALIYCPWSNVASLGGQNYKPEMFLDEYKGWSDFLGNAHLQWDVLLSQDMTLETLRKYKMLVLPSMLVLTEKQVDLFKRYLKKGGRIISTGETGAFTGPEEFLVRREDGKLIESLKKRKGFVHTTEKLGVLYYRSGYTKAGGLHALVSASGLEPSLGTTAPQSMGVNASILVHEGETSVSIDLNNYAYDLETDAVTPTDPCTVWLSLPAALQGKTLSVSYADPEESNDAVWKPVSDDVWRLDEAGEKLFLDVPSLQLFRTYILQATSRH